MQHHPFPKTPGKRLLSFPKRPKCLWGEPSIPVNAYWRLRWVKKQRRETCHSPSPTYCRSLTGLNLRYPYRYLLLYIFNIVTLLRHLLSTYSLTISISILIYESPIHKSSRCTEKQCWASLQVLWERTGYFIYGKNLNIVGKFLMGFSSPFCGE